MSEIRPIETLFSGYRFRSRLEARWATFFDALGIQWEYEKEGYDLGDAGWYLPDFWLPQVKMWAEVKPGPFSEAEKAKAEALAKATGHDLLRLIGIPSTDEISSVTLWPGCRDFTGQYFCPPTEWCAEQGQECELCRYPEIINIDYALTARHLGEGRFHSFPCGEIFDDTRRAVAAARSARFEHGESQSR